MPVSFPHTLSSTRLLLRPISTTDTAALFQVFSDPEVTEFWSGAAWTDVKQAEAMVEEAVLGYESGAILRYAIALADSDQLIGICNLRGFFAQNRRCELGYALGRAHWGCGYAREALQSLLGHAFATLDMNRIEADIDPRNTASQRLLEGLGFRFEGLMPERWIVNGVKADTAFYGLLRTYWDARAASRLSQRATS